MLRKTIIQLYQVIRFTALAFFEAKVTILKKPKLI